MRGGRETVATDKRRVVAEDAGKISLLERADALLAAGGEAGLRCGGRAAKVASQEVL